MMALTFQLPAQLGIVVDLAVEDNDQFTIGGGHGLTTRGQAHDGQPAMAEEEAPISPPGAGVRPPVAQVVDQGRPVLLPWRRAVEAQHPEQTTHGFTSSTCP